MPQYPQILEDSSKSIIIALSDTELGKVVLPSKFIMVNAATGEPVDFLNEMPTFEDEVNALCYANTVNDLMPKFIRKQKWQTEDGKELDMLVMERLYPLPIHHFEVPVRQEMMERFEEELKELHDHDFVHGDLVRPTNYFTRDNPEWMFQNIVQTEARLRLIDTGFGTICRKGNVEKFVHILFREREEIKYFRAYYLTLETDFK